MGLFITLEGIEGCGKSTQARLLAEYLGERGLAVRSLREPGGTGLGEKVRELLLLSGPDHPGPVSELFLYEAARAQLTERVIRPALDDGAVVVCDRFTDSTVAYQGYGRGLDKDSVEDLNRTATGGLVPDLTLVIDCDVEDGLGRAWGRINSARPGEAVEDRFEREDLGFHGSVRKGYLDIAAKDPARVRIVDGAGTVDEVHALVVEAVRPLLAREG